MARLAAVDAACAEIARAEGRYADDDQGAGAGGPRIDYLMMSQGGPVFQPRRGPFLPPSPLRKWHRRRHREFLYPSPQARLRR